MTIREGRRRLGQLADRLQGPEVVEPYVAALRDQAKRNASRRPTPQAPMASSALVAEGANLVVRGVVMTSHGLISAGAIASGSEWGSNLYPQFGPRRSTGAWVEAAASRPDGSTIAAADEALKDLLQEVAR